jgi:hypothetical protein
MFTQHHNRTRTLATLTLLTLAACTLNARADFQVGGGSGAYVTDDGLLAFDGGEDEVDRFIIAASSSSTLADLLEGGEDDEVVIDIALESATGALGFHSLADDLIDYQNGVIGESDLNVDAGRVTDWVQQRLLNSELEIKIGASIYKVMGASVVEITDGDATTLEWLRAVQQQRREIQVETNLVDSDVRWLSDSASNIVVHDWAPVTNAPEVEIAGGGMTQNYSTPAQQSNAPAVEAAGSGMTQNYSASTEPYTGPAYEAQSNGLPRFFSEPTQQTTGPEMEIAGSGMTQNYSTPSQQSNAPAVEAAGSGMTQNFSSPGQPSRGPAMETPGLPDGMALNR